MKKTQKTVVRLTVTAILAGLIIVLQLLAPFFKIGTVSLSFVLIPITVGAILYGWQTGAILGFVFGLMTVIGVVSGADAGGFMLFEAKPVFTVFLCFFKAMFAGILVGLLNSLLSKTLKNVSWFLSAALAPIVNTGIFVICLCVFYNETLLAWAGGVPVMQYIILSLAGINFLLEFISNIIVSPAIILALSKNKNIN